MIDALRIGVPIICTEAGGPKEGVIYGVNGYIIPCNDPIALSQAMLKIVNWDHERIAQCKTNSEKLFKELFSDKLVLSQWKNLFNKMRTKSQVIYK